MSSKILVEFGNQKFSFLTEPGVFSPNQLDLGSRVLLENLPEGKNVLDLGCGYGAMGIIYAKLHPERFVTLLDNNLRAFELTKKNVLLNEVRNVKPFKADVTYSTLPWEFDLIFSNPPWAKSKSVLPKLFQFANNHLAVGGRFYVVVNKTFPTEDALREIFGKVVVVVEQSPYKVLQSIRTS
ncbi:class I SAM-dependent methyltransferase [Candidatus Microgenomates bacterium]|nr:class I SAM-dependent methyltransferase [Candidatus Microgenomates bacterium]